MSSKTAYFKDSDWLLKNFDQLKNGLKSYHGEQNQGNHVREPEKRGQKQVSKVTLNFVWGRLSRKHTVPRLKPPTTFFRLESYSYHMAAKIQLLR